MSFEVNDFGIPINPKVKKDIKNIKSQLGDIVTKVDVDTILGYVNIASNPSTSQVSDFMYVSNIPITKAGKIILHARFQSEGNVKIVLLGKSSNIFTVKNIVPYYAVSGNQDIDTGLLSVGDGTEYIGFTVAPYTSNIQQSSAQNFYKLGFSTFPNLAIGNTSTSSDIVSSNVLTYYVEIVSGVISDIDTINAKIGNLSGEIWNALGDSITEYTAWQVKSYVSVAKGIMGISVVNNYGVAGTAITKSSSEDTTAFVVRYSNMVNDAGLITVLGGTNDYGHSLELGISTDTSNLTFYGALKELCAGLISKYPDKRIFFITPTQRNFTGGGGEMAGIGANTKGYTLKQYVDAIIEVCGDYGIPVIDLYRKSGLAVANILSYTSDGLHWNTTIGADRCGSIIGRQINSLT